MQYHKRHIENKLKTLCDSFKVVIVLGARQVGKSTLLSHTFPKLKLLTFDAVQDLYGAREDPDLFLDNFPAPIILDEIQYVPELLNAIKRRVDQDEKNGQYILTGSQNLSVLKSVSESLAGRAAIINLPTMTVYELHNKLYSSDKNSWLSVYLTNPNTLLNSFAGTVHKKDQTLYRNLWRGSYPGLLGKPDSIVPTFFNSYLQTYVERDVRLVEDIKNTASFGQFIALMAANTAQEINEAHLGRDVGIHHGTSHKWKNVLKNTYLWHEVWPWHGNAIKRLSKKRKGFISDTGLACYLQRISSPEALAGHPMLGSLFETWVYHHIMSLSESIETPPNIYHWRTNGGAEVDLILEWNGFLYPIEIKSKSAVTKRDASGIKAFYKTYPKLCKNGLIIYSGKECLNIDDDIIALPWNSIVKE